MCGVTLGIIFLGLLVWHFTSARGEKHVKMMNEHKLVKRILTKKDRGA